MSAFCSPMISCSIKLSLPKILCTLSCAIDGDRDLKANNGLLGPKEGAVGLRVEVVFWKSFGFNCEMLFDSEAEVWISSEFGLVTGSDNCHLPLVLLCEAVAEKFQARILTFSGQNSSPVMLASPRRLLVRLDELTLYQRIWKAESGRRQLVRFFFGSNSPMYLPGT